MIEQSIERERQRWLVEIDAAIRAAAQPGELECFERALARSCGDEVTEAIGMRTIGFPMN